ncbi:MAG: glycoside hydrolase family 57 protein [Candidatus Binatia bacterium]
MQEGFLSLILHTHLPYVRHPEYDEFLEEDWLYEAMTETYIPLIALLEGLHRDRVPCRLALSLTPPLLNMLNDPLLQDRYARRLDRLIELATKELERTRSDPAFHSLADMYLRLFTHAREVFTVRYGRNLIQAFRFFQDAGLIEVIACAATHGYLPLMQVNEKAVRAQIRIGVDEYRRFFAREPLGFWLPECGYFPGVDAMLKEHGIQYFLVDTHAILYATTRPFYGVYAPLYCPSGVAAFGRDGESSKQVWSSIDGYPGDFAYRDFYRDVGYDLNYDYVRPYLPPTGERGYIGIKYYRITGQTEHKAPYDPQQARERAAVHAGNFLFNREKQIEWLAGVMDRPPLIVAPYDAELFGHWWFEGPQWLDFLIRKVAYDQHVFRLITPSDYLERFPSNQLATPAASSWGYKGYHEVWLSDENDWIYRHLHKAAEQMTELAARFPDAEGVQRRALTQAARELLLAQSSDWAFLIQQGTAKQYATTRTKHHLLRFARLYEGLCAGHIDEPWLGEIEARDNIFPLLDYRAYA